MADVTRRDFVADAALAGAAIAAGAGLSLTDAASASESPAWDDEADVVVLGAGGAGMRAAYEAADQGASVLVVERAGTFGGTSMRSEGMIQAAGTPLQAELGVEGDTPEDHKRFYMLMGEGQVEEELVSDMCEHAAWHIERLESMGMKFTQLTTTDHTPYIDAAGIVNPPRIHCTEGRASEVFMTLQAATEELGVRYVYDTRAVALVQDESGNVIGVEATAADGSLVRYHALRGVVIATSSTDHNIDLARRLNDQQYRDLTDGVSYVATAETNTGDGILMAAALGAAIRNFGGTIDATNRTWAGINVEAPNIPTIMVNAFGRRFVCEDDTYAYVCRAMYREETSTGKPIYEVGGANNLPMTYCYGTIDDDVIDSWVEEGTAFRGDSIEELAGKMGVPAANLQTAIDQWNADVALGTDTQYGRLSGLSPIEAPFYAFTDGGCFNMGSIGGLAIDVSARVLDVDGNPIPHLYAAGMASAGWMGSYYPGSGTALLGGQHWGWRAGVGAANEQPLQ